jgi:hypothetical protein
MEMKSIGGLSALRDVYLNRFCFVTGEMDPAKLVPAEVTITRPDGSTLVMGGMVSGKVRKGTKMSDGSGTITAVTRKDIVVETITDKKGIKHNTTRKVDAMTPERMADLRHQTRLDAEKGIDKAQQRRAVDSAYERRHLFNIGPNGRRIIRQVADEALREMDARDRLIEQSSDLSWMD